MNKLEQMRTAKGMSRAELSEKTGIPYQTIASWENGNRTFSKFESLVKIANVLDCKIDDIVEG